MDRGQTYRLKRSLEYEKYSGGRGGDKGLNIMAHYTVKWLLTYITTSLLIHL